MRLAVRLSLRQSKGVNHRISTLLQSYISLLHFFPSLTFPPLALRGTFSSLRNMFGACDRSSHWSGILHAAVRLSPSQPSAAEWSIFQGKKRSRGSQRSEGPLGQNLACCGRVWDSGQVILMPLVNNKVGDDCTLGTDKALTDGKALVDSLIKVSCSKFDSLYVCYDC